MQAEITKPVIDNLLRFSQWWDMLDHLEIREELIRQYDAGKFKQTEVAVLLNIAPSRVAEMRARTRKVQQDELEPLARFLGMIRRARYCGMCIGLCGRLGSERQNLSGRGQGCR